MIEAEHRSPKQSSISTTAQTTTPGQSPGVVDIESDASGAAHVSAFASVHADLFAFVDERRHLHHQAGLGLGRLGHADDAVADFSPGSVSTTVNSTVRRQLDAHGLAIV